MTIKYFCGNTEIPDDLEKHETQRSSLYKAVAGLVRAYANISDEMLAAGYTKKDIESINKEVNKYLRLRDVIRHASGETIDLKAYEADMRHLIDTYIEADAPRVISPFEDLPLVDLIIKSGIGSAIDSLPDEIKNNKNAVATTIANNVRSQIIKKHLNDPIYYDKMSVLLDQILKDLKENRIEYEEYLKKIAELAKKVQSGHEDDLPGSINTPGLRALYNNLEDDESLAVKIHSIIKNNCPDDWRGVLTKERTVKGLLFSVFNNTDTVERIFPIIVQQQEY
jgi:type I restriction enzyme R subunit